jgi:PadR family transcriptional regulator
MLIRLSTDIRGWLASSWSVTDTGRRARFYKLTKAGRSQLEAETPAGRG